MLSMGWSLALLAFSAQIITAQQRRDATRSAQHVRRRSGARVTRVPLVRNAWVVVTSMKRRSIERHDERVARSELPAALDLIAVGIGSGASLLQSMELAAKWAHPNLQVHLTPVLRRADLGATLGHSLMYPSQSPSEVCEAFGVLAMAVALGTPLQPTLLRLSAEARMREARAAAAHARTIPVRMIFPLVLCVLPAFVLLTVVPALVAGWHGM